MNPTQGVGGPLGDEQFWNDIVRGLWQAGHGAARGISADVLGSPVDALNQVLGIVGLASEVPVGGSKWIGNKMEKMGILEPVSGTAPETAGRVFGAIMADPQAIADVGVRGKQLGGLLDEAVQKYQSKLLPNIVKPEYQGIHSPIGKEGGAPLHDLTGAGAIYPDDVYSHMGPQYYGTGEPIMDARSFALAHSVKGKPNATVTIYRAVPYEPTAAEKADKLELQMRQFMRRGTIPEDGGLAPHGSGPWYDRAWNELQRLRAIGEETRPSQSINPGDWVTINRAYAKSHGESTLEGNYRILSKKVKAKDIFTNGDSIHEWGYDPQP